MSVSYSSAQVGELIFVWAQQGQALGTNGQAGLPPWVSSGLLLCPGTQLFPLLWPLPYVWVEVMAQPTPVGPWYPSARGCPCTQDDSDSCRAPCSLCYRVAVKSVVCVYLCEHRRYTKELLRILQVSCPEDILSPQEIFVEV